MLATAVCQTSCESNKAGWFQDGLLRIEYCLGQYKADAQLSNPATVNRGQQDPKSKHKDRDPSLSSKSGAVSGGVDGVDQWGRTQGIVCPAFQLGEKEKPTSPFWG